MRGSLIEVYLHLVWATWDRHPCITPDIEPDVYSVILAKCTEHDCRVIAIGGIENHVHVLVRTSFRLDIAALVRDAKGSSSHLINKERKPDAFFRWQGGYGAFSVDPRSVPRVAHYVIHQKTHHADNTAQAYLEHYITNDEQSDYPA